MAAGPILSRSGFERIFRTQSHDSAKLSFYQFKGSSIEGVEKAKKGIILEGQKGRTYTGNIETFETEILDKPYLLKKGDSLELVSEKTAFEILKIHSQDVQQTVPEMAFGKAKWEKYFGDIGVEPLLPTNIEEILNSDCIFWPGKKVRETHLLILVPQTVNGKPFCLDSLSELIKRPKTGHKMQYQDYHDYVKNELGTKNYSSHWVLVTRDVIEGSRNKTYKDQKALVRSHAKKSKIRYKLPKALDITTAILMHYVETGKALYPDDKIRAPLTYSRCQERVNKSQWPVVIGGIITDGIHVTYDLFGYYPYCVGVGCARKL